MTSRLGNSSRRFHKDRGGLVSVAYAHVISLSICQHQMAIKRGPPHPEVILTIFAMNQKVTSFTLVIEQQKQPNTTTPKANNNNVFRQTIRLLHSV